MIAEGVAKSVVGTHATSKGHMLDTRLLYRQAQFLHEDAHDGMLERGGKVFLVMLHEVGVFLYPVSEIIEERRLKTAETIVESWYVRLAELICLGVALSGSLNLYASGLP